MSIRSGSGKSLDWITIGLWSALCIMGWFVIYSTTSEPDGSLLDFSQEYGKQFIWIGVCIVMGVLVVNTEGSFFTQFAWPIYFFFLLLLVLVLLLGSEINGAKAWFKFGGFSLQPAEFAKIGTALAVARFVSMREQRKPSFRDQAIVSAVLLVPMGLILLQPDLGSVLVFSSFIFALYREGWYGNILFAGIIGVLLGVVAVITHFTEVDYPGFGSASAIWALIGSLLVVALIALFLVRFIYLPRYRRRAYWRFGTIGILSILFCLSVTLVMDSGILKEYQKERIQLTFGLADEETQEKKGYNMYMAKLAIGSGGFAGKGFTDGPMTRYNFVPEQKTDFIFTAVGEEFGFMGCAMVLLVYLFFVLRLIFLAERQRSGFSRCFGYSLASVLFVHALINVGMVLGLAPVIGIPLPFFSYGGSSLMAFSLFIFIFLRLDSERLTIFR